MRDEPPKPEAAAHPASMQVRGALDAIALGNLRIVSAIGAALFGALALTKPFALLLAPRPVPQSFVVFVTAWEATTALLLLAGYVLIRRRRIGARWANCLLAGVAGVVLLGAFAQMIVLQDSLRTVAFILVMLAVAFFVTSPRWFGAMLVASLASWGLAVALSAPVAGLGLLSVFVAEAAVMAVMVFVARYRTIRGLERLHLRDVRHARELEDHVAARSRAEHELALALSEREVIMETVPDMIYQLDGDARLVVWNKQVEQVTGATAEELKGRPCAAFVVDSERALIPGLLRNCIDMGIAEADLHLLRRHAPPVLYQIRKSPIRASDGSLLGFAGVARDVSERRRAERRLAAQHAATSVFASGGEEVETTVKVLETIGKALDWSVGTAWTVTSDGARLKCIGTWSAAGRSTDFEEWSCSRSFARGEGLPGRVWAADGPVWVEDLAEEADMPRSAIARQEGLHAAFGFPIKRGRETIGVMEFFSDRRESLDPDLLRMMSSLGHQFGGFVDRKRTEERIWQLNADLSARVDELAAANRDLESFGYTVSHDLRAPLRGIRYYAETVSEDLEAGRADEATANASRICASVDRMSQIIEDLLALSRASAGELRREGVDLSAIVRALAQDLRSREPARDVEVVVPPKLMVQGDEGLLRTVLENLLGNAWKFTRPTPRPRIEVGVIDHADERVLFVRDNGAGFDMARADRLFRPFQRLHSEKQFEGTGVGLATVQRIVARHGGRIWAEGAPGRGATFYFTLEPRAGPREPEASEGEAQRFEAPPLPPPPEGARQAPGR